MSIPQSGGGPIERYEQMAEYLASGCKPKEDWRIGTEHEKFGFCKDSILPLPYEGERSIHAVLSALRDRHLARASRRWQTDRSDKRRGEHFARAWWRAGIIGRTA